MNKYGRETWKENGKIGLEEEVQLKNIIQHAGTVPY